MGLGNFIRDITSTSRGKFILQSAEAIKAIKEGKAFRPDNHRLTAFTDAEGPFPAMIDCEHAAAYIEEYLEPIGLHSKAKVIAQGSQVSFIITPKDKKFGEPLNSQIIFSNRRARKEDEKAFS